MPSPTCQWFFGPNGNASLPSAAGVTPMPTVMSSSSNSTTDTYTSTLQFTPLTQVVVGSKLSAPETSQVAGADAGFLEGGSKIICARKIFDHAPKSLKHAP